ncbi:hypothetical protein SB725_30190 [Pseudomonas sp. SIMBA_041]|uniref:hypothetical protein n=1 Tax=Pseudomonas sp. SIMBA_041 TaxID=3085782 RepID=UPI003979F48A
MTWTERLSLRIAQSIKTEETPYSIGQLAHGIEIFVLNVMNGDTLYATFSLTALVT